MECSTSTANQVEHSSGSGIGLLATMRCKLIGVNATSLGKVMRKPSSRSSVGGSSNGRLRDGNLELKKSTSSVPIITIYWSFSHDWASSASPVLGQPFRFESRKTSSMMRFLSSVLGVISKITALDVSTAILGGNSVFRSNISIDRKSSSTKGRPAETLQSRIPNGVGISLDGQFILRIT